MLRLGWVTVMLAVLAPVVVAPASAQVAVDDVLAQLQRTDQRIELAQTMLAGSDHAQAQVELDAAVTLQTQARSEYAAAHLRLALDLTLRARARADRAIAILRGPSPERVQAQLERTRELIDRARDRIEECDTDRAHALLRVAVEMQSRAEAAAKENRYLAALQLTLSARERTMMALRICKLEDDLRAGFGAGAPAHRRGPRPGPRGGRGVGERAGARVADPRHRDAGGGLGAVPRLALRCRLPTHHLGSEPGAARHPPGQGRVVIPPRLTRPDAPAPGRGVVA